MRQLRLLVIAVGCLIGGPVLIFRYFTALPPIEKLEQVSGVVQFGTETRSTRRSSTQYPVLIVGGDRYKYLDWFPKADRVTSLVRPGEQVTIWTDKGSNDWVWQIEQDGNHVVLYSEIRNAIASNKRFDWLIGVGVFVLGIVASVMLYRQNLRAA